MINDPDYEFVSNWRKRLASNPRFGITLPAEPHEQEPPDFEVVAATFLRLRRDLALGYSSTNFDASNDADLADRLLAQRPDLFGNTERQALIDAFAKLRGADGAPGASESR